MISRLIQRKCRGRVGVGTPFEITPGWRLGGWRVFRRSTQRSCDCARAAALPQQADHPLRYINRLFSAISGHGVIARFVQNRTLVPAVQPDDCIGTAVLRREASGRRGCADFQTSPLSPWKGEARPIADLSVSPPERRAAEGIRLTFPFLGLTGVEALLQLLRPLGSSRPREDAGLAPTYLASAMA
jgi:hypothetical protein